MYIGSTGVRGLHHLIYEVMDNSVDEALAGECDHVQIAIHPDNSVTVTCRSSVWANELELLGGDLAIRLNARIGSPDGPPPVRRLRFVTGRTGSAG